MRLDTRALAITGAVVAVFAYVLGAIINLLSPWGAVALVSYVYHVDLTNFARPFAWDSFVIGILSVGAFGAVLGALTARLYNFITSGGFSRAAVPATRQA